MLRIGTEELKSVSYMSFELSRIDSKTRDNKPLCACVTASSVRQRTYGQGRGHQSRRGLGPCAARAARNAEYESQRRWQRSRCYADGALSVNCPSQLILTSPFRS